MGSNSKLAVFSGCIQWQHMERTRRKLDAKAAILNKEQFVKLHYTAPGNVT